ncbi:hypothetical protein ASD11_16635 [Aeromicrobium sp. Root495]|uniref:hypothetical protein n=1 Tax=Aeromicrobium sp. Root495 TaxID=1736550 RepID=UPI0006F6353D|nr:hypothetical protein [Aeromicrobium sp. Root495]KQY56090.1 hypothetical protein ASD11_16635 [Aeromicrobium sp. Root495]RYJ07441.1 MAG: hypothetical protein EON52_01235 [Actinomycetales bacterium]
MGVWAGRIKVAAVALAVVVAVWILDRLADVEWPEGAVPVVRAVLLVAAVAIAGIAYQTWSTNPPRTPLVVSSMIVSLVGGAAFASAVTSAPSGEVLTSGPLPVVGVVALVFAVVALTAESSKRSPTT